MSKRNATKRGQRNKGRKAGAGGNQFGGTDRFTNQLSVQPDTTAPNVGGFGPLYHTKLRYEESLLFTSTSGSTSTQDWNLNGPYDPNATGSGAQPANFDDLMAHYAHYIVTACTVEFTLVGSGTGSVMDYVAYPTWQNSVATNFDDACAAPSAIYGKVGGSGAVPFRFRKRYPIQQIIGPFWMHGLSAAGTNAAIPASYCRLRVSVRSADGASTLVGLTTTALTYEVTFFGRLSSNLDAKRQLAANAAKRLAKELDSKSDRGDEKEDYEVLPGVKPLIAVNTAPRCATTPKRPMSLK